MLCGGEFTRNLGLSQLLSLFPPVSVTYRMEYEFGPCVEFSSIIVSLSVVSFGDCRREGALTRAIAASLSFLIHHSESHITLSTPYNHSN